MSKKLTLILLIGLACSVVAIRADVPAAPPAPDSPGPAPGVAMNNHYLDRTLRAITSEVEGGEGQWVFTWYDVEMIVVSDENADRMRVMTPVADKGAAGELTQEQLRFLLEVNFESALDAKYTIWQDTVWATFVHPLSWLSADELKSGARQVVSLHQTYGVDYTSTGLRFNNGMGGSERQN